MSGAGEAPHRGTRGAASSVITVAVGNTIARGLGFLFPLVVGRVLDRADFAIILLYISTGFFVARDSLSPSSRQLFQAISLWLSRNRYRELAEVPIEVSWV